MLYVCDKDLRCASPLAVIQFTAGVPRSVPDILLEQAIREGARPVSDEAEAPAEAEDTKILTSEDKIMDAVMATYAAGVPSSFTRVGLPKTAIISKYVGFSVSAAQVTEAVAAMPVSD